MSSANPSHSHIITVPTSPVNVIRLWITTMRAVSNDAMILESVHIPITTSASLAVGLLIS